MISECLTINNHEYTFVTFYVTQSLHIFLRFQNLHYPITKAFLFVQMVLLVMSPSRTVASRAKQELTLGLWVPISFKRFLLFGFVFSRPLLTQLALIDHWCKTLQRDVCRQV